MFLSPARLTEHHVAVSRAFSIEPLSLYISTFEHKNIKTPFFMEKKTYLFTSESVSEGHPDKVADQISDAIVDAFIAQDPQSKVACETLVTTGQVIIAGEYRSKARVDVQDIARKVINRIGYNKSDYKFDAESCGILNAMHGQSDDIDRGVVRETEDAQGAGDQGMMFGYACNETETLMPLTLDLSHKLLIALAAIRREGKRMTYLRPDAKSQVTVEYDAKTNRPLRIHTIVISTQHDDFIKAEHGLPQFAADTLMLNRITEDVKNILLPQVKATLPADIAALFDENIIILVNPTGKFVIGGPHGDTGLTGRKIIVDTYGGHGAHGGGAFSGKDPSKVDRSAAYAARHIAKNLVAAGIADQVLVQLAYAIGVAKPVSVYISTANSHVNITDAEIAEIVSKNVDLTPAGINKRLKLRTPIYEPTASYGHFGRIPSTIERNGQPYETFTWENLDLVDKFKELFNL